jgi:hypothetical protein
MSAVSPKPRNLPLGDALGPTIDRLRAIAVEAGNNMLTEGPVQPDHQLLELCGDVLHLLKEATRIRAAEKAAWNAAPPSGPSKDRIEHYQREIARANDLERRAKTMLFHVKKLRATTAAGIYAKALIVRSSVTGAADLAMTLAEDLINCSGLRESLWPAGEARP